MCINMNTKVRIQEGNKNHEADMVDRRHRVEKIVRQGQRSQQKDAKTIQLDI
jgi:hypothetical protein